MGDVLDKPMIDWKSGMEYLYCDNYQNGPSSSWEVSYIQVSQWMAVSAAALMINKKAKIKQQERIWNTISDK